MSDGSEADPLGILNPDKKRVVTGPTPLNTPESREAPSYSLPAELTNDPNRQVLWKAEDHPRWHSPDVFKPEKDPGHDTDAGVHRLLLNPRRKGSKQ